LRIGEIRFNGSIPYLFFQQTEVPFTALFELYQGYLGYTFRNLEKDFKKALCPQENDMVYVSQFKNFLKIFGGLDRAIPEFSAVAKKNWFHYYMSAEEAEDILACHPEGTFLVRFSSHLGYLSVSARIKSDKKNKVTCVPSGVYHLRVSRAALGYHFNLSDAESGNTLYDLLDKYDEFKYPYIFKGKTQRLFDTEEHALSMLERSPRGSFVAYYSITHSAYYIQSQQGKRKFEVMREGVNFTHFLLHDINNSKICWSFDEVIFYCPGCITNMERPQVTIHNDFYDPLAESKGYDTGNINLNKKKK